MSFTITKVRTIQEWLHEVPITKERKIQEWLGETIKLAKTTLEGEIIPIDLRKLPPQLKESIYIALYIDENNVPKGEKNATSINDLNDDFEWSESLLGGYGKPPSWSKDAPFPYIFKKYLQFILKLLPTFAEEAESAPINIEERISGGWKTGGTWAGTGWAYKGFIHQFEYNNQPSYSKEEEKFLLLEQYENSPSTFAEEAESTPINIEKRISGGWNTSGIRTSTTGWAYKGFIHQFEYKNQPPYSKEEEELLLLEQYDLERQKFEKLKRKYKSGSIETESYKRERISEDVRIAVWRRDDGKCARCGSRENLEYDHIVPVSKGGGNTARNIELLCEKCNRSKSNNIA